MLTVLEQIVRTAEEELSQEMDRVVRELLLDHPDVRTVYVWTEREFVDHEYRYSVTAGLSPGSDEFRVARFTDETRERFLRRTAGCPRVPED